ncbi:MAG: hypothetical protein GVY20_01325 [Bacteroidetes bacterium]|nr:hypothetical protein [Bacteroidota bacterium]
MSIPTGITESAFPNRDASGAVGGAMDGSAENVGNLHPTKDYNDHFRTHHRKSGEDGLMHFKT